MEFKIGAEVRFGSLHLSLLGYINEQANFGTYRFDEIQNLYIDFEYIEMINSTGVKYWLSWFRSAQTQSPELKAYFTKVPKAIVDQMNQIVDFMPRKCIVKSFAAPFFCEACDVSQNALLTMGTHYRLIGEGSSSTVKLPVVQCEECSTPMQPDFLPHKYFAFLDSAHPASNEEVT